MGLLKNLWTRIESAYSTAETSPKQPGTETPPEPRGKESAMKREGAQKEMRQSHRSHN
ncbi:MAG: hypothetical protein HYZ00_13850, partial [Candidatus Hydrogenedentes bacterium]|nr:hypothetical protein [Candidatus Hydrogenedentota bacterium]